MDIILAPHLLSYTGNEHMRAVFRGRGGSTRVGLLIPCITAKQLRVRYCCVTGSGHNPAHHSRKAVLMSFLSLPFLCAIYTPRCLMLAELDEVRTFKTLLPSYLVLCRGGDISPMSVRDFKPETPPSPGPL